MKSAAVVIPAYKEWLNPTEAVSLAQGLEIFRDHDIHFVLPDGLRPQYTQTRDGFFFDFFEPGFFASTRGYNRLMVCPDFYRHFANYEYMLIYQLDSYAFRDELEYWCGKGFDYIGAPWFVDGHLARHSGNGGFSLRRTEAFLSLLTARKRRFKSFGELSRGAPSLWKKIAKSPRTLLQYLSTSNTIMGFADNPSFNEDYFYSAYGKNVQNGFRVADPIQSIPFAFEAEPETLFRSNGNKLPFGCHAFEKHSPDFWKQYIPF